MSNENFQKMITQIFTPQPVFIGENTETQDELEKLLEEYDKIENTNNGMKPSVSCKVSRIVYPKPLL